MEVRNIGQGGQTSFDNTSPKAEKSNAIGGEAISTQSVTVAQRPVAENAQKHEPNSISEKELKEAVDKLSKFIEDDNTQIQYQYHSKFNDLMIKIVNKDTKEVLLEIPPQKILDLVAKMMEMVGVLFDKKA